MPPAKPTKKIAGLYLRDGFWYMQFRVNGRRVHKSTGKTDYQEAVRVMMAARATIEEETLNPPLLDRSINVAEAIQRVLDDEYADLKEKEPVRYREVQRKLDFWKSVLGPKSLLNHLDEEAIDEGRLLLKRRGLKPATVNRYLSAVSKVFTWAAKRRYIMWKPSMDRAKEGRGRIRYLLPEEERDLLLYLQSNPFPFAQELLGLVQVYLDTGLRRSELLLLSYEYHINYNDGQILVTADMAKSGKPRQVPMTTRVQTILKRRQEEASTASQKDGLTRPFPYSPSIVTHAMERARDGLKIQDPEEYNVHMLRHTFCTRLVQEGKDVKTIMELAGHESILTTQRYIHAHSQLKKDAVASLEKYGSMALVGDKAESVTFLLTHGSTLLTQ